MNVLQHLEQDILDNFDDLSQLNHYLKNEVEIFAQRIGEHSWEHRVKVLDADGKSRILPKGLALYGYEVYSSNDERLSIPQATTTSLRVNIKKYEHGKQDKFNVVILAHNSISDYLTEQDLYQQLTDYADVLDKDGIILIAARCSEQLLRAKIDHDKPRIFSTKNGRYIHFVLREWISAGDCTYTQNQYIIHEFGEQKTIRHTTTRHRAWRRAEINLALSQRGFAGIQYHSLSGDWVLVSARKAGKLITD